MIVLVGFMGAGKSTVGALLAKNLDLPFVDTDALIEQRAAAPIAEIFERAGEAAFRELEAEVVAAVLSGEDAVVALGGGALQDPTTRAALGASTVIWLVASFEAIMARMNGDAARPLLQKSDPEALFLERQPIYKSVASFAIATEGKAIEEVVRAIVSRLRTGDLRWVDVDLDSRSYPVVVGRLLLGRAAELLHATREDAQADRVFVVTHPSLAAHARKLNASFERGGIAAELLEVPEGESSKSWTDAEALCARLADAHARRHDLLVGLGGGVITDLAGFVASIYNRGMPLMNVPTTLLAQVDAAIGGKNGVNLPQGKNLVGTIYQPCAVLCDVELLQELPPEELSSGVAEVVKHALIADADLLELLRNRSKDLLARDPELLMDVIARSVEIKAKVVSADEREEGARAILNYGHTFAHAIENALGYGAIRHGEAVALGMMAAAYLARELDLAGEDLVAEHREVLEAVGLPVSARLDEAALERAWQSDKKFRDGARFVLLTGVGKPEVGIRAPRDAVAAAVQRLAE